MTQKRPHRRAGAAAVEFAFVAPVFVLLLLGVIELSRGMMVQQIITNATRQGAREAALPESTIDSVKNSVADFLAGSSIPVALNNITVDPDPATTFKNEQITVAVEVEYDDVSWIPGSYLQGKKLRAFTRMRSERLK
jgi:Flp pilus assembly protein TadG